MTDAAGDPLEARIGSEAMGVLRHANAVYSGTRFAAAAGMLLGIVLSAVIPVIRDHATIPVVLFGVAGIVASLLAQRWWVRQQRAAARLAGEHLGGVAWANAFPPVLLRHGTDGIDAWLATNGLTNPVTGLVPPPLGPHRPPFRSRMRGIARLGMAMALTGFGLVLVWGAVMIYRSVAGERPWPGWAFVAVVAFVLIGVAFVVVFVEARLTVRRRLAWAKAFEPATGEQSTGRASRSPNKETPG